MAIQRAQLTEEQLREATERKEARREYLVNLGRGLQDFIAHPTTAGAGMLGVALHGFANRNYSEGLAATAALVYGAVTYAKGKLHFTETGAGEAPLYEMTEWFFEKYGTPIKGPRTNWLLRPFIRKLKRGGKIVTIPATIEERDIKTNFQQPESRGGASGEIKLQFGARIPTRYDARKFYKETDGNFGFIDDIVKSTVRHVIANMPREELISGDYAPKIEEFLNKDSRGTYKRMGVRVEVVALEAPNFDERTKAAIRAPLDAEKRIIEEQADADSLIIRANAQAREARIQQIATTATFSGYIEAFKRPYVKAGIEITPEIYEIIFERACKAQGRDNLQQTLSNARAGTLVNLPSE